MELSKIVCLKKNIIFATLVFASMAISVFTSPKYKQFNNDTIAISLIANNIQSGHSYTTISSRDLYRQPGTFPSYSTSFAPLHPVSTAALEYIFGRNLYLLYTANVLAIILFCITFCSLGYRKSGLMIVALVIMLPDFRSELSRAGTLATFSLLIPSFIALTYSSWVGSLKSRSYYYFGFVAAILYLCRFDGIIFLVSLLVLFFLKKISKINALKITISAAIFIAPYWILNYLNTGLVLVSDNSITAFSTYIKTPLQFTYFSRDEIIGFSAFNNLNLWKSYRWAWFKENIRTVLKLIPLVVVVLVYRFKRVDGFIALSITLVVGSLALVSLVPYASVTRYTLPSIVIAITVFCIALDQEIFTRRFIYLMTFLILLSVNIQSNLFLVSEDTVPSITKEKEHFNKLISDELGKELTKKSEVVASDRAESISYIYGVNSVYNARNFDTCNINYKKFLTDWKVSYVIDKVERFPLMTCIDGVLVMKDDDRFVFKLLK